MVAQIKTKVCCNFILLCGNILKCAAYKENLESQRFFKFELFKNICSFKYALI
jgi:hypothetical protein